MRSKNLSKYVVLFFVFSFMISTFSMVNKSFISNDKEIPFISADEDNYEENDDETEAYDISANETKWLSEINGTGTQADDDWYEIYIDEGYEHLIVNLTFTHSEGNIDLYVYDTSFSWEENSYSSTDNESIDVVVPSFGIYYVYVTGQNAANVYDLWWNDIFVPVDDNYEQNDYDYDAYDISANETKWLEEINGTGIQWDDDWYEISVDSGYKHLKVNLTFTHADGDINIELYHNTQLLASNNSDTDNEILDYIVPYSGTHYLRIFGDNAGNEYNLQWNDTLSPPDDNYEENDVRLDAYDISANETKWLEEINGTGLQWNDDWYEISVDSGYEYVLINLTFISSEGSVRFSFYNSSGYLLETSTSLAWGNQYLNYQVIGSGVYYIKVYGDNLGHVYDLWWNDTVIPIDDNYEENDVRLDAYDISANETKWLEEINGTGIQWDDDWYEISVDSGYERLLVNLTFTHAEGDINIDVYNGSGFWLTDSWSFTDNETIDYVVPQSGTYFLYISGNNFVNEYNLWWNDTIFIPISDDNYEENNNRFNAYNISANETKWLEDIDGKGIQYDEDWYEIYVDSGYERLLVNLTFTHAEGNINIQIYSGFSSIASSLSFNDNEYINYILPSPGIYYIRVFGDNAENEYNLWWNDTLAPIDDNYEQNDVRLDAYDISANETKWLDEINGTGLLWDLDYYEIFVDSGFERLLVNCTFTHADGDINIIIDDASGFLVAGSWGGTDNEIIDFIVPSSGIYYIFIFGDYAGNEYNLWWNDTLAPIDDNYEHNDLRLNAYDLSANETKWLEEIDGKGIQYDDDWYKIEIDPGYEYVKINCTFTHADGDINIGLYNASGELIIWSETSTDNETINFFLPLSGTYYICVYGYSMGNEYDLWWNDALAPNDDNYEENDVYLDAYDISANETEWLEDINGTGLQYDYDWYEIYVDSGYENLLINCTFIHANGNIDISLHNNIGNIIAANISLSDNESISIRVPSPGIYYIRVFGDGLGNEYNLWWNDTFSLPDDNYEQNECYCYPYDLSENENTWLDTINGTGLQWDIDWYEIYVDSEYELLQVSLLFTHAEGNINIILFDISLMIIAESFSITDNEYLNITVPSDGIYFIYIFGDNRGNGYNLWWNDIQVSSDPGTSNGGTTPSNGGSTPDTDPTPGILDDNYESNNNITQTYDLSSDENTLLSIINGSGIQYDDDWYEIYIESGYEHLVIELLFNHTQGNIDIALYNNNGVLIIRNSSVTDNEQIDYIVSSNGTYYMKIYGNNSGNVYDLKYRTIQYTPPNGDDDGKSNNEFPLVMIIIVISSIVGGVGVVTLGVVYLKKKEQDRL